MYQLEELYVLNNIGLLNSYAKKVFNKIFEEDIKNLVFN